MEMEIKENNNLYAGGVETEPNIKIRWKAGWMAFFIVSGINLLAVNPFIYSRDYQFSIISVAVLAFGTTITIILSLYFIEKMLVENRFKVWKVATTSLIFATLFIFFYFISTFFYLQTIGSTEGFEAIASIFFGVILFPFSIFIIFVSNIIFCKFYEKRAAGIIFLILFISSIIFSFSVIGIRIADYNNCNFGKNNDCLTGKALNTDTGNTSLCEANKYANPHKRNECYFEVGGRGKDLTICDKIVNDSGGGIGMKNACVANVAFNTNNPQLCDSLKGKWGDKDDCYIIISEKWNDLEICNNISDDYKDEYSRHMCITNIAINNNDKSYCEIVKSSEYQGYCRKNFDKKEKYFEPFGYRIFNNKNQNN